MREIKEELDVDIDKPSLKFIGEYIDVAAGDPTKDVSIRLYEGKIIGEPKPSHEIKFFHWLSRNDLSHPRLSPIIRNKILPDLIKRNILK
jgi:8-oxo-dGTP pyrophosphatase MutT (NUDIX family)